MKKRIISLLLSAVMLFSLLPTTAFARSNSVELSDHAKMLLKKAIEWTGETQEDAIKAVADYLDVPTCYDYLCEVEYYEQLSPETISDEDILNVNALCYVAFLKLAFCLNGFAAVQNAGFDQLKGTINELPPVAYELLDLFDAVAAEDYANVVTLASQVGEDGFEFYKKVLKEDPVDEPEEVTEADFLTAFKTYVTNTSVSGDLLNNTKKASEQYAAYIAELCGVTDSESLSKFRQYADDWAEDEGNRYMLNYYGNLLSEDEFSALPENEKQDYIHRTLVETCLSFFDTFMENHFAKIGEHFSVNCSEELLWGDDATFVSLMRYSLDKIVANKESMINLIGALQKHDKEQYTHIYEYLGAIIEALSEDLYTDWDNLFLAMQGKTVVTSAFEVEDTDNGRSIKLLKDISCARLGIHGETISVAGGTSVTLDLNGHKLGRNLKAAESDGDIITVGGNLTVQNSSKGENDINMDATKAGATAITGEGNLAIVGKREIALEAPKGIHVGGDVTLSGNLSVTSSEVGITCDELIIENGGRLEINLIGGSAFGTNTRVTIPSGYEVIGGRINADGTFTANEGATQIIIRKKAAPAPSAPTITVPVTGDETTVKVQASVSGSTATVKDIKATDLAKVTGGENVEIDLSGLNKNIDTAKIPTTTVEKIAEQGGMSVKLSTATVTFDSKATETISEQAKGNTIELVVDDIKTVSLNAVQKEAVQKLDAALIIDAYLVSNGTRLCSESKGGFGGGKATVALPYEIKGNRTAANYSVYYVDDAGKLEKLNASYDAATKAFVFDIEHFSNYVVAYDENTMLFADVAEGSFYYDAVLWAAENGITDGADATHFNPNGGTTRAHVVTFLWRAAGCPEPKSMNSFADVAADTYYAKAVAWAIEQGITKGTSATTFSPNSICTRAQIAAFMARYAGVADADCQTGFTDVSVNAYYASAVAWMLDNGVTEGTTATTYSPDADCTRAQIVTFLYRWMVK